MKIDDELKELIKFLLWAELIAIMGSGISFFGLWLYGQVIHLLNPFLLINAILLAIGIAIYVYQKFIE